MKLFKSIREDSGTAGIGMKEGHFKTMHAAGSEGMEPRRQSLCASFPQQIGSLRKESELYESGHYLLFTLLRELASVAGREELQLIMKQWGDALAGEMAAQCAILRSEERFDVLVSYLNQLMIQKRLGTFECTVNEASRTIVIDYFCTTYDRLLLENFGETLTIAFYGSLFEQLMGTVAETRLSLASVEGSDDAWRLTLKA